MIALPRMLVKAATEAGIEVPEDLDNYDPHQYPYWRVYSFMQLGASMPYAGCHWDNAKIVAGIPRDKIEQVTAKNLYDAGFAAGMSK